MKISNPPAEAATATLLERAVKGDTESLSELLEAVGPRVEAGLQIGRSWQGQIEAGDVMQITYLEAFLQIGGFQTERAGSFEAWLRRIAENNLRDAIRGMERLKQLPPARRIAQPNESDSFVGLYEQIAAATSTPSRIASRNDIQRLLHAAIDRLPPDYATAVRLYDLEGKSVLEVAAAMNRSPGAIHMLRARAHERLAELLGTASAWFVSGA